MNTRRITALVLSALLFACAGVKRPPPPKGSGEDPAASSGTDTKVGAAVDTKTSAAQEAKETLEKYKAEIEKLKTQLASAQEQCETNKDATAYEAVMTGLTDFDDDAAELMTDLKKRCDELAKTPPVDDVALKEEVEDDLKAIEATLKALQEKVDALPKKQDAQGQDIEIKLAGLAAIVDHLKTHPCAPLPQAPQPPHPNPINTGELKVMLKSTSAPYAQLNANDVLNWKVYAYETSSQPLSASSRPVALQFETGSSLASFKASVSLGNFIAFAHDNQNAFRGMSSKPYSVIPGSTNSSPLGVGIDNPAPAFTAGPATNISLDVTAFEKTIDANDTLQTFKIDLTSGMLTAVTTQATASTSTRTEQHKQTFTFATLDRGVYIFQVVDSQKKVVVGGGFIHSDTTTGPIQAEAF